MANNITISGLDDCLRMFDNAPKKQLEISKKAAKEAGREVAKTIKASTPRRWRNLVKSKVTKTGKGSLNIGIGFFNGHQQAGHQNKKTRIDDWFKAYWSNYGTLSHRAPGHQFKNPIKRRTTTAAQRRKNKGGQRALLFFESAIAGYEAQFLAAFQKSLKKHENEMYE